MIPPLFLITDRALVPDLRAAVVRAVEALPLRSCAIVLREKDLPVRELVARARALREPTWRRKAKLVVSGRFDVAIACGADGVHLGGEAPDVASVRAVVPKDFLVGCSLHGTESAPAGASYAFLSPVFETSSKPGATALGLAGLSEGVARSPGVPIVALGGIEASHVSACFQAGARAVALRSAWTRMSDPELASLGNVALGT